MLGPEVCALAGRRKHVGMGERIASRGSCGGYCCSEWVFGMLEEVHAARSPLFGGNARGMAAWAALFPRGKS